MKKLLLFLPLVFLLSNCTFILKRMYGIHDPKVEDERSIRKKALKFGLDTSNIVTLNSTDFLDKFKGHSFPDIDVFDSKGEYIEYRATDTSCNAGLFDFIPALQTNGNYNKTGKLSLKTELAKCRDLKGRALKEPEQADFYLLINWVVWLGKLNKDHVKVWEDLAKANTKCKIKVIKVNHDLQKYWGKTENQKIKGSFKKKKKKAPAS